jgi:hypothetical protein
VGIFPTSLKRSVEAALAAGLMVAFLPAVQFAAATSAHAAGATAPTLQPGAITLSVTSATTVKNISTAGAPIAKYKWIINSDDTGDPGTIDNQGTQSCLPHSSTSTIPGAAQGDTKYADTCSWPSVRPTSGFAPIVAQGDETSLSGSVPLKGLPGGKYLISVTADGYKIDGQHFTVNGGTQLVKVGMVAVPLPLTTLRIQVFNDSLPVDATWEMDAENKTDMSGFTASLTDVFGRVSTDYYGNPLCTAYVHETTKSPTSGQYPIIFDGNKPRIDVANSKGTCVSNASGLILIPNLGPNRLAATVSPPGGLNGDWVQTTTLEGGHDHDIWSQEGATGYDTEQTKGAELVPSVQFGFVKKMPTVAASATGTGEIVGNAIAGQPYIGGAGGQVSPETGLAGIGDGGPIPNAWIALSDLNGGDQQVYTGQADANGHFDIKNVATGSYQLSIWDFDQDYILWSFNIEVTNGQVTDVGNKVIVGWFTHVHGKVFIDSNGNGKLDPGEKGVPQFGLTVRERDNSTMDQGTNAANTDTNGNYDIKETYPLGKFLVLEAFNTRYKTTGISYKGENDPSLTTQLGSMVDVNFLPIIGLGGEIDWGVQPYDAGTNGGIVGTVTYDTTRNELDPADAVTEAYQPGIPNVPVHLYAPQKCTETDPASVKTNCRQGFELKADGSIMRAQQPQKCVETDPALVATNCRLGYELTAVGGAVATGTADAAVQDTYTSEEWKAPRGCTARQWDGTELTDQQALPPQGSQNNALCVEAPMAGVAIGVSDAANGAQTVNGNYGFSTSKINLYAPGAAKNPAPDHQLPLYAPLHCAVGDKNRDAACPNDLTLGWDYPDADLPATDFLVGVDLPDNPVGGGKMYKVTSEQDVNIFTGDSYLPQENYPPATAAAGAIQSTGGDQANVPTQPISQQAGIISPCAGPLHTVKVTNPDFLAGGGSPFEGQARPSCVDKIVTVRAGQATAPNFNLFTDVPIPTHFWGLTLNDLGLTLDKRSVNFGEAQGMPYVPVGLYDSTGRLSYTTHTDYNGLYEALVPSTDTYNCPVPAGPCPNMYRFVGNDPGQPGALNADYNPRFRTIATNFQAWPGQYTVTDEAPTQVATTALAPGTTTVNPTQCDLGPNTPQLLSVDRPYIRTDDSNRSVVIRGFGFTGSGTVKLGGTTLATSAWSDTQITATVPSAIAVGAQALSITNSAATPLSSYNAVTIQILKPLTSSRVGQSAGNPALAEVGPGKQYSTIQAAIEAARPTNVTSSNGNGKPYWLVVVWPNAQTSNDPQGQYTENVIVHHRVHIQGVGAGGFRPDGSFVPGSIIDGSGFNPDSPAGLAWVTRISGLTYSGNPAVPDAAVLTVLDDPAVGNGILPATYHPTLDGFTITGGAQSDFPANINELTGGITTPYGAAGALVTQGGGIYVHSHVRNLEVTDNVIKGNGGSYGGAIRVGTPYQPTPATATSPGNTVANWNTDLVVANNQIRDNGGTNLAGGIGIFNGSDGYQVVHNAICGNHSSEYGGAVSAFGYQEAAVGTSSKGGTISNNRMWFNSSYDEGGAVMIAGELPPTPTTLSAGTGRVTIDSNVIQANLANDDGGGIRLLQVTGSNANTKAKAEAQMISITNNEIASNISAHEGGGIALDDAPFVNIVNDTIANNVTTATAVTSDGTPAPAGVSSATNSDPLNALLATFDTSPQPNTITTLINTPYSKPTMLNDIFWDNRSGSFDGSGGVCGIGSASCTNASDPINNWDMGVADNSAAVLSPTYSVIQDGKQVGPDASGAALNNATADPQFKSPYLVDVNVLASRAYPAFRQAIIIAQILPPSLMGDYHLKGNTSPAYGLGVSSTTVHWGNFKSTRNPQWSANWSYVVSAPSKDIDGDARPAATPRTPPKSGYDAGSDQLVP